MNINVDAHISSIFREWVFVRGNKHRLCECDIFVTTPVYPVNDKYKQERICAECGGTVTDKMNRDYNQFNGYSGFDDGGAE